MTDPFVLANPDWCLEQGIIDKETYDRVMAEINGELVEYNGQKITKAELRKLLNKE